MVKRKTPAQLDAEIARALRLPPNAKNAAPHLAELRRAFYQDQKALPAAIAAASKHMARMNAIALRKHPGGGHVDETGTFDPDGPDLANLLVRAKDELRAIRKHARRKHARGGSK